MPEHSRPPPQQDIEPSLDAQTEAERIERRRHLRLITPSESELFEREVMEVLQELSPESKPASPGARRFGRWMLGGVILLESLAVMGLGGYFRGWEGAFFGVLALFFVGTARAFILILVGILRERDLERAKEVVRERRRMAVKTAEAKPSRQRTK